MTYPAKDGTPIPMFVRFPKGCAPDENAAADPCPVVVEFHGGPEAQATPGFSPYRQMFVDAGYVFVEPNVRGSDGYGKTWLDADNGAQSPRRDRRHRGCRAAACARSGRATARHRASA